MAALSGMKEIRAYCGDRSEATIKKWIVECDFPAEKFGTVGTWESDTDVIDEWRRERLRKRFKTAC